MSDPEAETTPKLTELRRMWHDWSFTIQTTAMAWVSCVVFFVAGITTSGVICLVVAVGGSVYLARRWRQPDIRPRFDRFR